MIGYPDCERAEQQLLTLLNDNFNTEEQAFIIKALELAKEKHADQYRDEGPPFVIHPIRVAIILISEIGIKDQDMITSALLHDIVEDTNLTIDELTCDFGDSIAQIVCALTRDKNLETKEEKYRKTLQTSKKIRLIKSCDWLDNMRSWKRIDKTHPSRGKFPRWFNEAKAMYIPLAKSVDPEIVTEMENILIQAEEEYLNLFETSH